LPSPVALSKAAAHIAEAHLEMGTVLDSVLDNLPGPSYVWQPEVESYSDGLDGDEDQDGQWGVYQRPPVESEHQEAFRP
jgi:hypothetical protein